MTPAILSIVLVALQVLLVSLIAARYERELTDEEAKRGEEWPA